MYRVQRAALPCAAMAFVLALAVGSFAQTYGKPADSKPADSKPAGHEHAAQGSAAAAKGQLTAELVDAANKAKRQEATVRATVKGLALVDPAQVGEKPRPGQGHLHYQVDDGPVIATTTTKLSFHGLKPGTHKIMVMLAANDHSPLGPQQALEVTIPSTASMN